MTGKQNAIMWMKLLITWLIEVARTLEDDQKSRKITGMAEEMNKYLKVIQEMEG